MTLSARETTPGTLTLDSKLGAVLGAKTAAALRKAFGHETVADLLVHYPRRYAKRGELTPLAELPIDENVTIVAKVVKATERPMRARRGSILEVQITDGTGTLTLTFFNQAWRSAELKPGAVGIFAGKVGAYKGARQLAHPDYELFDDDETRSDEATAKRWAQTPIPMYPATASLPSWRIQKAMALVLDGLGPVPDPLPAPVRTRERMLEHRAAIDLIHRPNSDDDVRQARETLRYTEAFVLQLALLQQRQERRAHVAEPREPTTGGFLERFDAAMPFELTSDQRAVGRDVADDLASTAPMNRLIQGEVGSGKTLVALRAMLAVADSGGQAALIAPTEVLAAQHLRSIVRMLGPDLAAELMPTLVTGQMAAGDRRKALLRVVSGQARIVVGTHALISDTVSFYDLGLIVVDEQHRFGVEQREALRMKAERPPHVLVLTATPIPRTVAMTAFGDLDVSTIRELPVGRAGIETFVVPLADRPGWEPRIWQRLREELEKGRQAFIVCPAIDDRTASENDNDGPLAEAGDSRGTDAKPGASVESVVADLAKRPELASARIAPLHGRMSAEEKDRTMRAFAAGDLDVLVATTVIEVGVDVPNASMMVVLDADRFGVSQLHQLRGRVGRGAVPGLCLLVTSAAGEVLARQRVEAVAATTDGFELAQVDLELRHEGDVLGSAQAGSRSSLRLLRVARDVDVIVAAREAAAALLESDPTLAEHPAAAEALRRRLDETERGFLSKS